MLVAKHWEHSLRIAKQHETDCSYYLYLKWVNFIHVSSYANLRICNQPVKTVLAAGRIAFLLI